MFICLKDSASLLFALFLPFFTWSHPACLQTNTHARNNKINEGKQRRKNTNGKAQCDHVKKGRKKKQAKQTPSGI
jgi:hypothetical protein